MLNPTSVHPWYRQSSWAAFASFHADGEVNMLARFQNVLRQSPSLMIGDYELLFRSGKDLAGPASTAQVWQSDDDLAWSSFYLYDYETGFFLFKVMTHTLVLNDASGTGTYLLGQSPSSMMAAWNNGPNEDEYNLVLQLHTGVGS